MSEYIDKIEVRDTIHDLRPDATDYSTYDDYSNAWDLWNEAYCIIDGATPADVAPVKHGRWIENDAGYLPRYCCSVCSEDIDDDRNLTPYCPYCGAKMNVKGDTE